MSNEVERIREHGLTATLIYDETGTGDPRDMDNLATLLCWHPDYILGDEQFENGEGRGASGSVNNITNRSAVGRFDTQEEVFRFVRDERKATVILPLFLYDHSGITISAGEVIEKLTPASVSARGRNPFDGAGWDTSWVGFAYATEERRKLLGVKRSRAEIERQMREEIEEYDRYLRGEVFGVVITDRFGFHLDSLWGLLGHEYATETAHELLNDEARYVAARELNRLPVA